MAEKTCPACNGHGWDRKGNTCSTCHGSGTVNR